MLSDYGIESNKKTQRCRHRNCLLKASLTFTDVPGLLCRVVVWPMESLGSSSRNYSDFDNWKCTSPRQHQHCTGSGLGWPSFLPPTLCPASVLEHQWRVAWGWRPDGNKIRVPTSLTALLCTSGSNHVVKR